MSDETPILEISDRHADVLTKLTAASKRSGKGRMSTLVAVSKVQPDARITEMLKTGQNVFGENRVQEAQTRWGETFADQREGLELRLIGPLQSNKAADAVALFDVIETVDREKLLQALVKAVGDDGKMPRLYVQVNTGEEAQKSGVMPADLSAFLTTMRETYNLEPEGLMCIPPAGEAASPHFWMLSNLAEANGVSGLSMGMSGDFEIAAEMGATSVRVGSALFGARNYN